MKKHGFFLLSLSTVICLSGCCHKMLYCSSGKLNVFITGYPRIDVVRVIIKRYAVGDHTKALDSAAFVYSGNKPYNPNKPDTLDLAEYTGGSSIAGINDGNDWLISFPATRENYFITGIGNIGRRKEKIRCSDNNTSCINEASHFEINGMPDNDNTLYIQKPQ